MCNESNTKGNLVPVTTWNMESDPGYVSSSGWQRAVIVPADKISAGAYEDPRAFFDFACVATTEEWATRILRKAIIDREPYNSKSGVCSYSGYKGLVAVPKGCVLIVYHYEDISTRDGTLVGAKVVGGKEALSKFYRQRADHYTRLAERLGPQPPIEVRSVLRP